MVYNCVREFINICTKGRFGRHRDDCDSLSWRQQTYKDAQVIRLTKSPNMPFGLLTRVRSSG